MNEDKKPKGHVYHLHLHDPKYKKSDFYFSSLSAIYEVFSVHDIGCTVQTLWNRKVARGNAYSNSKCTITVEPLFSKEQNSLK